MTASDRLYRSPTDSVIGGVCGGIAERFDFDPVLVRLGAVLFTLLAPPVGVVGYLASWVIMPVRPASVPARGARTPETSQTSAAQDAAPHAARIAEPGPGGQGSLIGGAIMVGVGLIFLLVNLGFFDLQIFRFWRWRVIWPLVVIGIGLWVVVRSVSPSRQRRST